MFILQLLLDPSRDLQSVNSDIIWRIDPQLHNIPTESYHLDGDVVTDLDHLI